MCHKREYMSFLADSYDIYKISPLKHIKHAVMNERFLNLQQMVLASIALMESNSEYQE